MIQFQDILDIKAEVYVEAPQKDIHSFVGTYRRVRHKFYLFWTMHTEALHDTLRIQVKFDDICAYEKANYKFN